MDFLDRYILCDYIKQNISQKLKIKNADIRIVINGYDEISVEVDNMWDSDEMDEVLENIINDSIIKFAKERGKEYVK